MLVPFYTAQTITYCIAGLEKSLIFILPQSGESKQEPMQAPVLCFVMSYAFSYAWPSAAGGIALPTTPLSTIIVTM